MKEEVKEIKLSKEVSIFSNGTVSGANIFIENGYEYFNFEGKRVAVHRIIAQYFLNQGNSIEELDVHHIDFNRNNNNVNNLLILTKQRHVALHRYLETPEGYRQLQEDIRIWRDKAKYYKKKAQRIENLNVKMEQAVKNQDEVIKNLNISIEKLNNMLLTANDKFLELDDIINSKIGALIKNTADAASTQILISRHYSTFNDKKLLCEKCIKEFGKVTAKNLKNLGCKNSGSVYQWYKYNIKK